MVWVQQQGMQVEAKENVVQSVVRVGGLLNGEIIVSLKWMFCASQSMRFCACPRWNVILLQLLTHPSTLNLSTQVISSRTYSTGKPKLKFWMTISLFPCMFKRQRTLGTYHWKNSQSNWFVRWNFLSQWYRWWGGQLIWWLGRSEQWIWTWCSLPDWWRWTWCSPQSYFVITWGASFL